MPAISPDAILPPGAHIPAQRELTPKEELQAEVRDVADALLTGRCADGMRNFVWEIRDKTLHVGGLYVGSRTARLDPMFEKDVLNELGRLIRAGAGPRSADSIQLNVQMVTHT